MFNVRFKNVHFVKAVLAITLVVLIALDATASGHVLRRRREIIVSDSGHVDGNSPVAPPPSEITADDVPNDSAHSLKLNSKTKKIDDDRVGIVDISNTNSSSTTSKYSQNDITISSANGSTTSLPFTTPLPSSTTDVNNAIATDALDKSHVYDVSKHQRTTSASASTSKTIAPTATHRSKEEPKVSHDVHEMTNDKRAKFLVDSSADFPATTVSAWADLKNIGEVNHNNVPFSKVTDADIAVVKLDAKTVNSLHTAMVADHSGSTDSMNNAGATGTESQKHMFDLKRNSSQIDDTVHQDISINVLPAVTSTSSPATTSTTPKVEVSQATEHDHSATVTLPRYHDEIELHLLTTTTEDQLSTTTERAPYETTLVDESETTVNTLSPTETERRRMPVGEETTRITELVPDTTIAMSTLKPSESFDQTTVEHETEHTSGPITEPITDTITTIDTIAPVSRTSTMQPDHVTSRPAIEAETIAPTENKVEEPFGNSVITVTTDHGNEIETTEKVAHRIADEKSATIVDASTQRQMPSLAPVASSTPTTDVTSPSTSPAVVMTTTMTTTTTVATTTSSSTTTTSTTTTSTTTEAPPTEETPDQAGVGEGLQPHAESPDVNAMIAITISVVSVVTLILLVGFLIVMRKRQKQLSYAQRCRPLGLDDAYSLDNISVYNSVRRKSAMRASKRAYGNAAFDDPALKNNLLTIPQLAAFVQRRTSIYEEFRDVPLVTARIDEVPAGCEDKNRYANVVPLPESRVHLQPVGDDETTEYINANFVKGPKDTSHYYIACQAPMENTILDFWRMIWEQNSRVIIMATDLTENGIEKCAEYLPPSFVIDNHVTFGDFTITLKNREVRDKYAVSTMHLKNEQTKSWREITHLWYQWPETGTPSDETSIIAMLLETRSYLKMAAPEQSAAGTIASVVATDDDKLKTDDLDMKILNGNSDKSKSLPRVQGPLTVHCSPGTGRTGTIIACDIAIRTLEQPTRSVDIPQIVYRVRRGRASAVQTREQYEFIYKVAQMYATKLTGPNNEN